MSNTFPPSLVLHLTETYGLDRNAFLSAHDQPKQLSSIRINPAKRITPLPAWQQIPWCNNGYHLPERPVFTLDPLFHAGCYYVQEASSMFLDHIIRQLGLDQHPLKALDLCAAPGGKSTMLNSSLHPESLLVANEPIKTRANTLADNLTRWGNSNTVVTNNDPQAFSRLPGFFDLLLVDAPCSGSGMFRKDPAALAEWSEPAVKLCSQRQQRILNDSLGTLKEGGTLIYATCSFSTSENESIADWLCDQMMLESIPIPGVSAWGVEETLSAKHHCYGYRFYPHKVKGEGFFVSVFQKTGKQASMDQRKLKPSKKPAFSALFQNWLHPETEFSVITQGDDVFMIPAGEETAIQLLQHNLYLKKAGTKLGKVIRNEFIPHHELALSNLIHPQVNRLDLDLDETMNYLRKSDINKATDKKGWLLISYQGYGLGWAKSLPNRINNYYPKEWRIIHL